MPTIGNAPLGEDSSIDESEKIPVSGSKWMSIATFVEYIRTKAQTLTNKTLTTPTIASFANATHDHSNAAGGGLMGGSPTTFTPVIAGTSAAGAGTYSTQSGKYIKVGGLVFFRIALAWSAHTGTGNMIVTGLPFTSLTDFGSPVTVYWDSLTLPAVGDKVLGFVASNSTQITIQSIASGGVAALAIDTAGTLFVTGWYMT